MIRNDFLILVKGEKSLNVSLDTTLMAENTGFYVQEKSLLFYWPDHTSCNYEKNYFISIFNFLTILVIVIAKDNLELGDEVLDGQSCLDSYGVTWFVFYKTRFADEITITKSIIVK